jgi:hypothetical protein
MINYPSKEGILKAVDAFFKSLLRVDEQGL